MHAAHQSYDQLLVALSYLVAVLGSYTALQLAMAIPAARTAGQRFGAVLMAGAAIGVGGIWAMHFIGMIACDLGMEVGYDPVLTAVSAVISFGACSLGLYVAGSGEFSWAKLVSGGVYMGLGVAGMHYLGMYAMRLPATQSYNGSLVAVSVAIAIVASVAALWLAFNLRGRWQMIGSALVMGLAVCGMHYTGMVAVDFLPDDTQLPAGVDLGMRGESLATTIFMVVVVMLLITLVVNYAKQKRRAAVTI